jgi:DNA polymerase IV
MARPAAGDRPARFFERAWCAFVLLISDQSPAPSRTLDIPISATAAEIAEALLRGVRPDHSHERFISLLATTVSHLERYWDLQLELPFALPEERRRPGTRRELALVSRPRDRQHPQSLRRGGGRLPVGRARPVPFRARLVPRTDPKSAID